MRSPLRWERPVEGKAIARMEPHVSGWIPPRSAQWGGFAAGIALFAVLWLMLTARPPSGVAEWAWNEIWALVPVLISLLLIRRRRWGWAAFAALLAACIRETAVLVLVGGLIGAIARRDTWRPWAAALAG